MNVRDAARVVAATEAFDRLCVLSSVVVSMTPEHCGVWVTVVYGRSRRDSFELYESVLLAHDMGDEECFGVLDRLVWKVLRLGAPAAGALPS